LPFIRLICLFAVSEFAGAAAEDWMMIVMVEVMPYMIPWMTKNTELDSS